MHYKQVTARHSALDAESTKHNHLLIRGLRVNPAMTNWRKLSIVHKQFVFLTENLFYNKIMFYFAMF